MALIFYKILNMSISASWLILAVIIIRFLLKKAPKSIRCILWGLVGIRLICPFSLQSVLSLIPNTHTFDSITNSYSSFKSAKTAGIVNNAVLSKNSSSDISFVQKAIPIIAWIWVVGIFVMLLYALVTYCKLRGRLKEAVPLRDNIFTCDRVSTPFLLGIIHPRIYLPSSIEETEQSPAILHEQAHLSRHDNLWKPFGFLILCFYWFNPLVWIAYYLLCRDIEFACDEKVISKLGVNEKIFYTSTLLSLSISKKMISACPVAFGENDVKQRVKAVLNYKKPTFWILFVAIITCCVVAVCFLTNPKDKNQPNLNESITSVILEQNRYSSDDGNYFPCEAHRILAKKCEGNKLTVYITETYEEYYQTSMGLIDTVNCLSSPASITFQKETDGSYTFVDYWTPCDGDLYYDDMKEHFPLFARIIAMLPIGANTGGYQKSWEYFNLPEQMIFKSNDENSDLGNPILTLNLKNQTYVLTAFERTVLKGDFRTCSYDYDFQNETETDGITLFGKKLDELLMPDSYSFIIADKGVLWYDAENSNPLQLKKSPKAIMPEGTVLSLGNNATEESKTVKGKAYLRSSDNLSLVTDEYELGEFTDYTYQIHYDNSPSSDFEATALIAQYEDYEYESQVEFIENSRNFLKSPQQNIPQNEFSTGQWCFKVLTEGDKDRFPQSIKIIGYNKSSLEIAYLAFYDADIDEPGVISGPNAMVDFINHYFNYDFSSVKS